MSSVLVVGGGAAGMFAAIQAAWNGHEVQLFEQNEKLGKKLFITGKGRCNLTNAKDAAQLLEAVTRNAKFLYSSFYQFGSQDVMAFFEESGLPLKVERGDRVFPVSDHSSDVIRTLSRKLDELHVQVYLQTRVTAIHIIKEHFCGIEILDKKSKKTKTVSGDACIIATGGLSYPSTGATGDGYHFARETGHTVTGLMPSLVPFVTEEDYVPQLQGLSLRNVTLSLYRDEQKVYEEFGEMLFTHFGVSGPLVIKASSLVGPLLYPNGNREGSERAKNPLRATVDLKPGLTREQLDDRLLREFEAHHNKQFKNSLEKLFPQKLIPVMIALSGIAEDKKVHEINRKERQHLLHMIKAFPMTVTGLRGYQEAIVTKGGVSVAEILPSTMESRKVKGLFFAGEVLDLDAFTGGYNLQIAWSTAYEAGNAIPWK